MIRRNLCALIIAVILILVSPTSAQAFSLSLFSFSSQTEKTDEKGVDLSSTAAIATDSQSVGDDATPSAEVDPAVVEKYFSDPVETIEGSTSNVFPVPVGVIKGISTLFSSWHPGIDIRADVGSELFAIQEGVVVENGYQPGGYGRYVVVEQGTASARIRSLYAHMKSSTVEVGQKVHTKDVIGFVGMTGHTTGPHLHFETRICPEGIEYYMCTAIDPIRYITKGFPANLAKK